MIFRIAAALAVSTAMPIAGAQAAPDKQAAESKSEAKKPPVDPMVVMAQAMAIFDKIFPPGPDPEPARLAAARGTATTIFPKGAYSQAMVGFLDSTAERILDMSEADLANMFPDAKDKKAKDKKPPSTEPLRVKLAREEPNFEAKKAAMKAFVTTMLGKLGDAAEPKFREGMARAIARKFDTAQLGEINAFLATPTGSAYGRQMVGMWFEADVIRGTFQALPEMMKMLPELMTDAAAFEAQMKDGKKPAADKR